MTSPPRAKLWSVALTLSALALPLLPACSDDEAAGGSPRVQVTQADGDDAPYQTPDDRAVVVTEDGTYVVTGDPGEECVELDTGECVAITDAKDRYCNDEGAEADIIVVEGEVVDVICYPPNDAGTPIEEVERDGDGDATVPQNANGAVVTFDEATDGEPIEGDLDLQAERLTIWGNGVDETILDGDVTLSSNNSRVRGVTITGDLHIAKNSNNVAAAFCEVHGKLTVESNGATVANCQIFGDVTTTGNDITLINLGVGGAWTVSERTACSGCYSFDDEDEDFDITDEERGDPLACQATPEP